MKMPLHRPALVLATLCLLSAPALCQIKIGQTSSFTGPVASGVKEGTEGARLYIDSVNAKGGVTGQQIELISLDDKFDPKLAAENAKTLIDQGVVALFFSRGTPQSQAILPLLAEHRITLIAPSTGAMLLHQPVNPWVFNVRATYQKEAERAVKHLILIGVERIALLQSNDSFGDDGVAGALKGFAGSETKPLLHEKFDRNKPDFGTIAPKITKLEVQAVVFIGAGTQVVDGVAAIRAAGSQAQIVTLSNNAASGFVKAMKGHARGTVVSQVFPHERSTSALIVKELSTLLAAKGKGEVTPAMLEGYAAAKVLVEALKRAGKDPTREQIKAALESFKRVDIGGLEISYSPTDHTGLEYSDLSIIGPDGKFRR